MAAAGGGREGGWCWWEVERWALGWKVEGSYSSSSVSSLALVEVAVVVGGRATGGGCCWWGKTEGVEPARTWRTEARDGVGAAAILFCFCLF